MRTGHRVQVLQPAELIGLRGEIVSVESWGYEVLLDGDKYPTPFYRQEVGAEQEAA